MPSKKYWKFLKAKLSISAWGIIFTSVLPWNFMQENCNTSVAVLE